LIFFLVYYLFGIFIGFARSGNYYNIEGIVKFIIPIALTIILKEIFRYNITMKSEGNKLLTILSVVIFILIDLIIAYNGFYDKYDIYIFISLSFFPAISTNILCSYLTYRVGYKPNLIFLLVINLYQYLLPIIPNPNEYVASLINFLLPIVLGYKLNGFFSNHEEDVELERNYNKISTLSLIIPTIIVTILVYFTSGYFKYTTIAIASSSMENYISKGDVVIVKQIENTNEKSIETVEVEKIRQVISAETSQKVKNMMESVVTDGTGKLAKVEGYSIGGKSGTSEPTEANAIYVVELLTSINPRSKCSKDVEVFIKELKEQVRADIDFETKEKYHDEIKLKTLTIEAIQKVGVAFGNNQQPTTTNWLFK
jgi:hypothetical protein